MEPRLLRRLAAQRQARRAARERVRARRREELAELDRLLHANQPRWEDVGGLEPERHGGDDDR